MKKNYLAGITFLYFLCYLAPFNGCCQTDRGGSDFSSVPGTVISHAPASSGVFLGAPSIAIMPDGKYVASFNFTSIQEGDHGKVHRTAIYESTDSGMSWTKLTDINHQRWATIFYHNGALYLIGVYEAFGNATIRKSVDGGKTWTTPRDEKSGLLAKGRYHCASVPVVIHDGRIWRAMEEAPQGREFRAFMMSVPVDADLLNASNWTFSKKVAYNEDWYDGNMQGWLEGNAVVTPDKKIVDILRTQLSGGAYGTAAILQISEDGLDANFDPEEGFVRLPGATGKKFTIRYDSGTGKYWSLVNWIQPENIEDALISDPGKIRNTLALASSDDLKNWIIERIILHHADIKKHAFQYVDWQFDGNDIVAVSRTAYDDGMGGAFNFHDANFITFHRIIDFRHSFNKP